VDPVEVEVLAKVQVVALAPVAMQMEVQVLLVL
jgi:hypothetical protein